MKHILALLLLATVAGAQTPAKPQPPQVCSVMYADGRMTTVPCVLQPQTEHELCLATQEDNARLWAENARLRRKLTEMGAELYRAQHGAALPGKGKKQ